MPCQSVSATMALYDAITQQNIFGNTPIEIVSFTSNIGFNNSESSVTIDLVVNSCIGGFVPNLNTGYAVQFICNGFSFGGIVKRIEFSESDAGIKYKVEIGDARKLLDTVQLLFNGYYCNLNATNFINVLNLLEGSSAGAACGGNIPSGSLPSIGNCSAFGSSGAGTGRGVSYFRAIAAIANANRFVTTTAGTNLYMNLSPIVSVASSVPYATTDGSSMSLLDFITAICDEAGYDFIVTMVGSVINFITINRQSSPQFGQISSLISVARSGGTLISSSQGLEETYEPTRKIVIGDKVNYLKTGSSTWAPSYTTMLLGYTNDGFPIRASQTDLNNGIYINTSTLSAAFAGEGKSIPSSMRIKESELLSLGSLAFWKAYSLSNTDSMGYAIGSAIFGSSWGNWSQKALAALNAIAGGQGQMAKFEDLQDSLKQTVSNAVNATLFDDIAYRWLKSFYDEYYGKQWLVNIKTRVCYNAPYGLQGPYLSEGGSVLVSDVPAEGGWPDSSNILGLNVGTVDTALFQLDDGRMGSFIAFPASIITSKIWKNSSIAYYLNTGLLNGEYYVKNNYIYMPCSIDSKMYNGIDNNLELLVKTPFIPLSIKPTNATTISNGLYALSVLCGTNLTNISSDGKSTLSPTQFNILKDSPAAASFAGICIPMKSNMYIYGPYSGSSGSVGGTIVQEISDLNPWTYGGYQQMSAIGQALASSGLRGQNRSESGSITLAEAPAYSMGPVASLGGLVLGSVTTNFGESGVTTTYNFQTFTPKFGNYAQALANNVKKSLETRKGIFKYIKEFNQKVITNINNTRSAIRKNTWNLAVPSDPPKQPISQNQASPNILLYSSYSNKGDITTNAASGGGGGGFGSFAVNPFSCEEICNGITPVGLLPGNSGAGNNKRVYTYSGFEKGDGIDHILDGERYSAYAICSVDSIFAPVSLRGSGFLPRMIHGNVDQNIQLSKSRGSMPPIWLAGNIVGNLPITQQYLNPMLSVSELSSWSGRQGGSSSGFVINHIAYGDDPSKLYETNDGYLSDRQGQSDFRFAALKGPLVLQSWGYDTNGKPIPNKADSPASCENGTFAKRGLYDQFMTDWLGNQKTWPVGPIDLRWDRDRGVWVAPPPEKIVVAQLLSDLNPGGSAQAVLLNPSSGTGLFFNQYDVYGPNGEHITGNISDAYIMVGDFLGRKLCKGTRIYAYHYDDGKYIALEASIVNEQTCECECTTTSTETTPTTSPTTSPTTPSTPPTPPTPTTPSTPPTPPTPTEPPCDACDLLACLGQLGGDGVLGLSGGCLKIYPLTSCPSEG